MTKLITCIALATIVSFASAAGCSGDLTVTSQADLDSIRTCQIYNGKITINNMQGNEVLSLAGIQQIAGDLIMKDITMVTKVDLPDLRRVSGDMVLQNIRDMHSINMPQLTAAGSLKIATAPAMTLIEFPSGLREANSLTISDTTATEVRGVMATNLVQLTVDNNHYLKGINLATVTSVKDSIKIYANAPGFGVDLGGLQTMNTGNFRNIDAISLANLSKSEGDVLFQTNTFSSLELPKLVTAAKTISVSDNSKLIKLSIPELAFVGGAFTIAGNSALTQMDSFSKLAEVDGTVDITGPFDDLKMPLLTDVRGGMNLQTSSKMYSCDQMNKVRSTVVKGNAYLCKSAVSNPTSVVGGSTGSGGKGGSSNSNALGGFMSAGEKPLASLFNIASATVFVAMMLA
ncbi:hypothetical protein INT43_000110 [Umbelopsis isabellina]|uniref:Meiotic expression up-regulated protein 10 n=1 Tax=Mortierella isabellina TaxID=91625 RepID=A0A8H7UAG6_MORIS|nr:hypothetical protein INT43_000110 [Umbelopsis isabellina]